MNNASANIIKRQLIIIQYLLESNFVSTEDIQQHLKTKGVDAQIRTIQRDMVILEDIIPLEARKDDKPYSWRWKRLANTSIHGLSMSQALALRIVETELKGVIPDDLYERLTPLFIKAQFMRGISEIELSENVSNDKSPSKGIPSNTVPMSPAHQVLLKLQILLSKSMAKKPKILAPLQADKLSKDNHALNLLADNLRQQKLEFLADLLQDEQVND